MGTESQKVFNWITFASTALLVITMAFVGYITTQMRVMQENQRKQGEAIVAIQANRFTNKDGENHLVAITRNATNMETVMDDIKEIKTDQKEILNILHKTANK